MQRVWSGAPLYVPICVLAVVLWAPVAAQQEPGAAEGGDRELVGSLLELRFIPTARAQLALWLERADGEFVKTLRLTAAVAYRGIGNRPGASQMNSGFRWPYGRREGVLPIWARARASAPDAALWKRVIFQNRPSEGDASRTVADSTPDDYFCLSFTHADSRKDALDAVSCATTQFQSDKGRFLTQADVEAGYGEPYQDLATGLGRMRPLPLTSLYPPRRDFTACEGAGCLDHPDAAELASHAREVMPDIDAVTMATPPGGQEQRILIPTPGDWPSGDYRLCLEANVEGDHNERFSEGAYPTPLQPPGGWDIYAQDYGYPFRGQPSVAYCVDITLGGEREQRFTLEDATGSAATWDIEGDDYGVMRGMEGMTDDPVGAPGSGADRLLLMDEGNRLEVLVRPALSCRDNAPPGAVEELALRRHEDRLHAHEWARLSFRSASDDHGVFRYDVRVSTTPITDDESFMSAQPARNATVEAEALELPAQAQAGTRVHAEFGGLVAQTRHFVAVRATDGCAAAGPIAVAEITTPAREFATVSPCFVATAAFGTPLAREVGALRRLRDRHLMTNALGRALVAGYYEGAPRASAWIAQHETLRALMRGLLAPFVALAQRLDR